MAIKSLKFQEILERYRRWRQQFLVDVVGREFALDAGETRAEHLENALQICEAHLRALVSVRLFRSELSQMCAQRIVDSGRTLRGDSEDWRDYVQERG